MGAGSSSTSNGRSNVSRKSPEAVGISAWPCPPLRGSPEDTGRSGLLRSGEASYLESSEASGMPGLIAEEAALGFGASGKNLVPHLGHFRRLPAASSGTFNRMPHCVH